MKIITRIFVINLILLTSHNTYSGNWPGHAIVGNGKFCAVYSEDPRVTTKDGNIGIRHFYIDSFTNDYIKSAYFRLFSKSAMMQKDSIVPYMADFYTPSAKHYIAKKHLFTTGVRADDQGLVLQFKSELNTDELVVDFVFHPTQSAKGKFYLTSSKEPLQIIKQDSIIEIMRFMVEPNSSLEILISDEKLLMVMAPWTSAAKKWNKWIKKGGLPYKMPQTEYQKQLNDYYSRNLYAAWSSCLKGQVPADVTGQFLTNGMPQIYPRDALMTARNFMQCGYINDAAKIIEYWSDPAIPRKTPGEFYARYDAHGKATDAGSGARFDEPEWDAGAYLIILNEEFLQLKDKWLANPQTLFDCADFIVRSIDSTGLLYEGGIVEWTGYLPATNMICASALKKATELAGELHRNELEKKYQAAYKTIESSLPKLFDNSRGLYTARRYHGIKADDNFSISKKEGELLYLWDATSVFGILWGYPDHPMMKQTYNYLKNHLNDNGGVMYFEATDNGWLEAYGKDLFYFATAGWAKYAVMNNDLEFATKNINWIIAQSNIYGLMPERVLSDYSNISEASPLTWGCAEFAGAIKAYARIKNKNKR